MNGQIETFLRIDTPENVVFGYQLAGIGSRFLAAIVDSGLIITLEVGVYGTLLFLLSSMNGISEALSSTSDSGAAWALALLGFLGFAFFWGYYVFFELFWHGQTPGKKIVKLRVIGHHGQPPGISEAVIRNLVRFIDFLPTSYAIGVITMFVNDQSRRLGDFAAGTLVVYDRGAVTLENLEQMQDVGARSRKTHVQGEAPSRLPVEMLSESEFEIVDSFLQRRDDLVGADNLAQRIAMGLGTRMGLSEVDMNREAALALINEVAESHSSGAG